MQGWATLNFLRGRTTAVVLDSLVIKQGLLGSQGGAAHIVVQKFTSNIALFDQKMVVSFLAGCSVKKCNVLYNENEMKQSESFVFVCVL